MLIRPEHDCTASTDSHWKLMQSNRKVKLKVHNRVHQINRFANLLQLVLLFYLIIFTIVVLHSIG